MSDPSRHASEDIDLLVPDIQGLASTDALVAFFARLGWKTEGRITQQPGNLGITAESVKAPIKKIELIADSRDGLQVYLFELKNVTVAHTRALARNFRNLSGNFLLVLTSDYQQIDFVVLHRVEGEGEKQAGIRARGLTVERRAPEKVHLRVLRRFTWTEGDGFAQYFKLLSAFDVADWSEEQFNNRALFSDYYLKERLPHYPEWKDDPKPAWREFREIYREAAGRFAAKREKEIRAGLLEPALKLLGFSLQPGKLAGSSEAKADYTLFTPGDPEKPAAFCLAYPWNRWLDGKDDQRDAESPEENPGAVVVSLLEGNAAPWGIVTNGRLWRLYSQKTHAKATNYFEIDLEEILSLKPEEDTFRYYWLLFRAKAFEATRDPAALTLFEDKKAEPEPTGAERKPSLLDRLLTESENYAKELGERLKGRVFEEIFPHLAEGFITHIREKEGKDADLPEERLGEVFHGTLTLLYRLLFLLYAESRDLLPVRETRGYYEASLAKLKREIAAKAGTIDDQVADALKDKYRDDEYGLWKRLTRLFQVVDKGDAELNVPLYNGGLFITDPAKDDLTPEAEAARFLAKHKIPDRHLARALDLLSRDVDDKRHDLVMIDYKSLGVRQLGSIYEGLLEFRIRIATEKLGITKEKSREVYTPFRDLDDKAKEKAEKQGRYVRKGAVYLENDKRERKATGSYYTPDYIVKYIVENAVGPVLKEKFDAFRPRLREAQQWQREMKRLAAAKGEKQSKYDHGPAVENKWQELVNALFDVKVLDPAMGSGHFLVEAVDFITDKTIDFLNGFPWNPVFAHLEAMRGTILAEMDRQQITVDRSRLTDVNLLKRHVLKRCIYGVDLNPMAVELAKVSLWLDCFTLGAPLSFLDHHLRCGNSLIGATEKDIDAAFRAAQMGLFAGTQIAAAKSAVGAMIEVGSLPDATAEQAAHSRERFADALGVLAPLKRVFDVYTSQWFGNEAKWVGKGKAKSEHSLVRQLLSSSVLMEWAKHPEKTKLPADLKPVADTAAKAAGEHRFFHWELEFPEVFFGPRPGTERLIERLEGAGFDALVGNPPYVRQETITGAKAALEGAFMAFDSAADLYVYFIERGLSILRTGCRLGFIVPNKWFRAGYGEGIRDVLSARARPLEIIDFGHSPIFDEADTFPCILLVSSGKTDAGDGSLNFAPVNRDILNGNDDRLPQLVEQVGFPVPLQTLSKTEWKLEPPKVLALLEKIQKRGVPLKSVIGTPTRGVVTGLNDAFIIKAATREEIIKADPASDRFIKPMLRGRDIARWVPEPSDEYMILLRKGDDIDKVPGLKRHLARYRKELEARAGDQPWFALQGSPGDESLAKYFDPKIVYQEIMFHSWFSLDSSGHMLNNKAFFLPTASLALLGTLNSSILWWYMTRTLPHMKDEALTPAGFRFETMPIALPRGAVEKPVLKIIELTGARNTVRRSFQKLLADRWHLYSGHAFESFWRHGEETVLNAAAKARERKPDGNERSAFSKEFRHTLEQLAPLDREIIRLEREINALVEEAYGLTDEDRAVMDKYPVLRDPKKVVGW